MYNKEPKTSPAFIASIKQDVAEKALQAARLRAEAEYQRKSTLQVAKDAGIATVHIFDPDFPKGGLTVAYRKATPYKAGAMVEVAVATCSDQDTFNKKLGTQLALDAFFSGTTIQLPLIKLFHTDDIAIAVKRAFSALYNAV